MLRVVCGPKCCFLPSFRWGLSLEAHRKSSSYVRIGALTFGSGRIGSLIHFSCCGSASDSKLLTLTKQIRFSHSFMLFSWQIYLLFVSDFHTAATIALNGSVARRSSRVRSVLSDVTLRREEVKHSYPPVCRASWRSLAHWNATLFSSNKLIYPLLNSFKSAL